MTMNDKYVSMSSHVPPPPAILSTDDLIQYDKDPTCSSTPSELLELNRQFMIDFDKPCHPDLDFAIENSSSDAVLAELQKARAVYPAPHVTFNSALIAALRRPEIALLLLDEGVLPTPETLQKAVISGATDLIERMMDQLSWPINKTFDGSTLLTCAVQHDGMVDWLLEKGADPNVEDMYAETPLSRAVESGSIETINTLLRAGADVKKGTPLHAALRRNMEVSLGLINQLIKLGAPVNKVVGENSAAWDFVGFARGTPLHSACKKRRIEAIRLLLNADADPTINERTRERWKYPIHHLWIWLGRWAIKRS